MAFENEHLLKRDQSEFEYYWMLLSFGDDKIEYHVGHDFTVEAGELVVVDEADALMFKDPTAFQKFTSSCACICFTATPDNQQANGIEAKVVAAISNYCW